MKKKKSSPSFEESIDIIDGEIIKRRNKWNLSSLTWIDFDDVSQIIRIHIYKKWHLYNPKKPLAPWVNRIISNQIKNLIRNNYLNFIRPCAQCPEAEPDEGCKKFGKQCSNCPLFKEWEKNKKHAYNLNMPVSFESLENTSEASYTDSVDIDKFKFNLDAKMKQILKPLEWKLYEMLYIKKMTEKQAAKKMGYKSTEENRNPGYKQIKNMQKAIIKKLKQTFKMAESMFTNALTEEQQNKIINEWNSRPDDPPSLLELIRLVYPDKPDLDGRAKEGKYIQAFLAKRSLKARGTHEYKQKKAPDLSEENKQFILNNAKTMKPIEIARIIFDNPTISSLNNETRIVAKFISENILPEEIYKDQEEIAQEDYISPRSLDKAVNKVNKYVYDLNLKRESLNSRQKKDLECLLKYINTYRFIHQINSYENVVDRELFESSFIRYTYDKNDLTEEEVDQYIILSTEVVIGSTIQRRVEKLQNLLEAAADNDARISMGLVESINTAQQEYNQCVSRQQKLVNDLKTKRSDRLGNQIKQNASIVNLIQAWKEEESRIKMIKLAEMRKKTLDEEITKLEGMDELKCRILGISKQEILNG